MSKKHVDVIQFRKRDLSETNAAETFAIPYWADVSQQTAKWIFDPWTARKDAFSVHGHIHTEWAECIYDNHRLGLLQNSAGLDWSGETIYIVGRGESLEASLPILERPRSGRAIFLNGTHTLIPPQPQDFALIADNRVRVRNWLTNAQDISLITFPGVLPVIITSFKSAYGFALRPSAPLNNFMRRLFPHLVELCDTKGVIISMLHLAALNNAARVVLVGTDFTTIGQVSRPITNNTGTVISTSEDYASTSMALSYMAKFALHHTGMQTVCTSTKGLCGADFFDPKLSRFPWMRFESLEFVYNNYERWRYERRTG